MITTVVGSYPKVAERTYGTGLISAVARWQRGELDDAQLEAVYRDLTRRVIAEQEADGLALITDGQLRWEDLVTPVARGLAGVDINGLARWFNNNVYFRQPVIHRAPTRRGPLLVGAYRQAAAMASVPVKAVLPGPYTMAAVSEDRHYGRCRPCVLRLAEQLNAEARALAEAGAPVVQFDEPAIGFGTTEIGLAVEGVNVAASGVRATTVLVTYFGVSSRWLGRLSEARVDVLGIDAISDPQALPTLKRLRVTKGIALGCVDARNTRLETVDALHRLFEALERIGSPGPLYVSPNCGLEFLPHTQARAKVRRLVEAVRSFGGG